LVSRSVHGHVVEHVDDLGEQRRGGDREARVLHVVGVGRLIAAELAEEGKDLLADDLEHDGGVVVLEPAPAEMVLAGQEGGVLEGLLEAARAVLLEGLELVESPDEQEVGDLLDDLDGVADAPGPEGVPDAVDLALEVSGDHPSQSSQGCSVRAGPARLAAGRSWTLVVCHGLLLNLPRLPSRRGLLCCGLSVRRPCRCESCPSTAPPASGPSNDSRSPRDRCWAHLRWSAAASWSITAGCGSWEAAEAAEGAGTAYRGLGLRTGWETRVTIRAHPATSWWRGMCSAGGSRSTAAGSGWRLAGSATSRRTALRWESLDVGHGEFVHAMIGGGVTQFYDGMRWPGREADCDSLGVGEGFALWPPPFSVEGCDLALVSRRAVPIAELFAFYDDAADQLG
jgi:hypothetical protein